MELRVVNYSFTVSSSRLAVTGRALLIKADK
jgi:hypothetical protein